MKSLPLKLLFAALIIGLSSCSKTPNDGEYIGHWEILKYEVNSEIYERVDALPNDNYGFSIYENGKFIENKNAGWCGTPPICYETFKGTWKELSESMLEMNTSNWSENNVIFDFEILSIDANRLEIVRTIP